MSQLQPPQSAASRAAVGGKTTRACDGCLRRRARWYCASDDAFLCQSCDSAIHSANPLARRHERLRLKPAPAAASSPLLTAKHEESGAPVWLTGFTRKARTPRPSQHAKLWPLQGHFPDVRTPVPDLTENSADENLEEEEDEEQLLYRVPIFDPVLAEFSSPPFGTAAMNPSGEGVKPATIPTSASADGFGFVPSDMDLAEFAADMETLLRQGLDGGYDTFSMEGLGLLDVIKRGDDDDDSSGGCAVETGGEVKLEKEQDDNYHFEVEVDTSRPETLDIDFDCGSSLTGGEDGAAAAAGDKSKVKLRLDYEAIISMWTTSPWTGGERPHLSLDDGRSDFMGMWIGGGGAAAGSGQVNRGENGGIGGGNGGREARVTRYREKRRTRLFSKKIRYEVRKLNAEKRPRMKGRFVKRASFGTAASGPDPTLAF